MMRSWLLERVQPALGPDENPMRVLWLSLGIVLADQLIKWLVRSQMYLGQSIEVLGPIFRLTYTENPGIAFGLRIGDGLWVTFMAIAATLGIGLYLYRVRHARLGYRLALASILGGAVGNLVDRIFYAKWFGYGDYFQGRVVDYLHIDLWRGEVLGHYVALWPIFNLADVAIVTGVVTIFVFQKRFF
ncbi:MAG: signal peptidase II [Bacteroidota bacterium]|nr:signal peptidase II [Rhodothermia bacterium]MDW8286212.1 signal peptidase II [Bacteroidota bacterium]